VKLGKAQSAQRCAVELVKRCPGDGRCLAIYALVLVDTEGLEAAAPVLERAVQLDPSSADAVWHCADVYRLSGRYDDALALLKRHLQVQYYVYPY
jgi:tetratricopeptide (TPR) repeat protein